MSWECFMSNSEGSKFNENIGAMWFATGDTWLCSNLSDYYKQQNAPTRQPLWVMLPAGEEGKSPFCLDSGMEGGGGWNVTGEAPNITVHPSINMIGQYHGWLKDGVLSDDVDGRMRTE